MRVAVLGYAQAGKRTLFRLLTGRAVPEGRKEGETVEGLAAVRDGRVDAITRIARPKKKTYAEVGYALCPDVGTGNERPWLESARRADVLAVVVRGYDDATVYHPLGSVDANRDRQNLLMELALCDLEVAERRLERIAKERRAGSTPAQELEARVLQRLVDVLGSGGASRDVALNAQESAAIGSLGLLTRKPVLVVLNVAETALAGAHDGIIPIAAKFEQEVAELGDESERREYLADMGVESLGVDRLNAAAYSALGLMSFYTMGPDEVRAWTIRKGALAPRAGGKIHSDIERGFIRVEIIKFDDLIAAGSEDAAKAAGRMQLRGKDYVMEDGDICHFLFNV
jgi:GTP-binding protein YchF